MNIDWTSNVYFRDSDCEILNSWYECLLCFTSGRRGDRFTWGFPLFSTQYLFMCWPNLSHSYPTFDNTESACEELSSKKLIFGNPFFGNGSSDSTKACSIVSSWVTSLSKARALLNPGRSKEFSFLQNLPDQLWFPSSRLFNGYRVFFSEGESDRGVKLTALLRLVPRLRTSGTIPVLPLYALMACTLTPLPTPLRARRPIGDARCGFPITSWNTKLEVVHSSANEKGVMPVQITGARRSGRGSGYRLLCLWFVYVLTHQYKSLVKICSLSALAGRPD